MKTSDDIPAGPLSEHELREQWNQQADEHNQWESLDSDEQLAWAQVRAIARDREAAPPADGEVTELVYWLDSTGELAGSASIEEAKRYWRAAELLQQRYPAPVPVSERLPEPGCKVLACYVTDLNKCRIICAVWVPAKTWDAYTYTDDDSFGEYDEETDKYFWPEGWYETIENWDDYQYARVHEGEVTHWQPLPQWPAVLPVVKESLTTGHALPLPAAEGK